MASFYISGDISNIAGRILMVLKAKLVFGLLKWYNLISYQTQINRPAIPDQIYWIKFVLGDQTKFIQPTIPNYFGQRQSWSLVYSIDKI